MGIGNQGFSDCSNKRKDWLSGMEIGCKSIPTDELEKAKMDGKDDDND